MVSVNHSNASHRHPKHQEQIAWPPERLIIWGNSIGDNTGRLIEALIARKLHPEQSYRACMGVIRLADKYTKERLERACARALSSGAISYQSISAILQNGLDQFPLQEPEAPVPPIIHHNIRGVQYYCSKDGDVKC
jgi:transposase